ncbi:MAG TPA: ester cyclase [Terriglobales bacterium]|nr:ester cyclase [Terriglobales bacterium]
MTKDDLRRRRLEVLAVHFQAEVDHDWDACLATFKDVPRYEIVPTAQIHEGRDAVRAYHVAQRTAFPDQRHENVRMHVADDDTVVAEFDLIGTNTGPFMGLDATGKSFRLPVIAVFAFDGERITNERVYLDAASLLRQIGRTEVLPLVGTENFAAKEMRG